MTERKERPRIKPAVLAGILGSAAVSAIWFGWSRAPTQHEWVAPTIPVWEETLWQVRDCGIDYLRVLSRAEAGDANALRALIRISHCTDAAGSLGHSTVLVQLMRMHGDEWFAAILGEVVEEESERHLAFYAHRLEAGVDYSDGCGKYESIDAIKLYLVSNFPMSYAAAGGTFEPPSNANTLGEQP